MVPQPPNGANPAGIAASEVLIQPGTGRILAIANDRSYGTGMHQTTENYAVNSPYDGGVGVQTGSSSKLFTLLTALEQNVPFGFPQKVPAATTLTGYTNCKGQPTGPYNLINDSPSEKGAFTLYTATAQSVNIYFAMLERKVGLCNVVKTAAALGVTRADGKSLLKWDGKVPPADNIPAFTLGAVNVSPMSMAEAYATVAARGVSCTPIAVAKIVSSTGARLPVAEGPLPPGDTRRHRRRGQLHPAERADGRDRGGPRHRPPCGGQDRNVRQLRLRRLRRLHPRPGRRRVGVQPDGPGQVPDVRYRVLLPARLSRGRHVRRGRARRTPGR